MPLRAVVIVWTIPYPSLTGEADHFVSIPRVLQPGTRKLKCVGFGMGKLRLSAEELISFEHHFLMYTDVILCHLFDDVEVHSLAI